MSGRPHNLADGAQLLSALTEGRLALTNVELEGEEGAADEVMLMTSPVKPDCKLRAALLPRDRRRHHLQVGRRRLQDPTTPS